jgi:hypothetical protein
MAVARLVLPQLAPLLCPVPREWGPAPGWPVLEPYGAAAGLRSNGTHTGPAAAAPATASRRQLLGGSGAEGVVEERVAASSGAAAWWSARGVAARRPQRPANASAAHSGAADAKGIFALAVAGAQGARRRLRMQPANAAKAGAAATAAKPGGAVPAGGWVCRGRCLGWEALWGVAEAEAELQQRLPFDPVFPGQVRLRSVSTAGPAAVQVLPKGQASWTGHLPPVPLLACLLGCVVRVLKSLFTAPMPGRGAPER